MMLKASFIAAALPLVNAASWTGTANNWDGPVDYRPANLGLRGIQSWHSNHREDRQWKFWMQTLPSGTEAKTSKYYGWTGKDATWDYQWQNPKELIVGMKSAHDNNNEDRQFWFETKPTTSAYHYHTCRTLGDTAYDGAWTKKCDYGNEYVTGIRSWHSNHREDRQFRITCCQVTDPQVVGTCHNNNYSPGSAWNFSPSGNEIKYRNLAGVGKSLDINQFTTAIWATMQYKFQWRSHVNAGWQDVSGGTFNNEYYNANIQNTRITASGVGEWRIRADCTSGCANNWMDTFNINYCFDKELCTAGAKATCASQNRASCTSGTRDGPECGGCLSGYAANVPGNPNQCYLITAAPTTKSPTNAPTTAEQLFHQQMTASLSGSRYQVAPGDDGKVYIKDILTDRCKVNTGAARDSWAVMDVCPSGVPFPPEPNFQDTDGNQWTVNTEGATYVSADGNTEYFQSFECDCAP